MYATKQVLLCLALSASANAMGGSAVPQGLESDVDPVSFTETRMIEDPSKVGKKCGPYQNGAVNTPRAFDNRLSPGFVATEVACSAKCLELETCVAYSMGVMPSGAPGNLEPDDGAWCIGCEVTLFEQHPDVFDGKPLDPPIAFVKVTVTA
jgi:hypothetical protein